MSSNSATLWVVATPLGNLGDLSPRAGEVMAAADLILAEDTRRSGLLLKRAGLPKKQLMSLFEHNEQQRIPEVLRLLEQGATVALISDAGTPLISDPGYKLVRAVREAGYVVSPVPGPSAPLAALMVCGLPPLPFTFLGFLPRKSGERRRLFASFASLQTTLVFFERKNRLQCALDDACAVLGEREFCVTRELTKVHEQVMTGRLGAVSDACAGLKGEITVVVAPAEEREEATPEEDVLAILDEELGQDGAPKSILKRVQQRISGWSQKELYDLYLRQKPQGER